MKPELDKSGDGALYANQRVPPTSDAPFATPDDPFALRSDPLGPKPITWHRADPKPSPLDGQVGGDHYKKLGDYQPWKVCAEWMTPEELRGLMKGTVIWYLARERDKGGDLDIEKALHTMQLWQEVRKDK